MACANEYLRLRRILFLASMASSIFLQMSSTWSWPRPQRWASSRKVSSFFSSSDSKTFSFSSSFSFLKSALDLSYSIACSNFLYMLSFSTSTFLNFLFKSWRSERIYSFFLVRSLSMPCALRSAISSLWKVLTDFFRFSASALAYVSGSLNWTISFSRLSMISSFFLILSLMSCRRSLRTLMSSSISRVIWL